MIPTNKRAMSPVLIVLATLALSACSKTIQPQSSMPFERAGEQTAVKSIKNGMCCACCGKMEKAQGTCCADMENGCPCCSGMASSKGMMCAPKDKGDMSSMDHSVPNGANVYAPAMKAMHENMSIAPTGDADVDFMQSMIPHHQGAVDMAKIALIHGKDPSVKKLAQDVIRAQESEITFMRKWLSQHGQ